MNETSVFIVGGGPVGLAMGLLLHRFGIPCVVVERSEVLRPVTERTFVHLPPVPEMIPGGRRRAVDERVPVGGAGRPND